MITAERKFSRILYFSNSGPMIWYSVIPTIDKIIPKGIARIRLNIVENKTYLIGLKLIQYL
jgi:hypothetical protein